MQFFVHKFLVSENAVLTVNIMDYDLNQRVTLVRKATDHWLSGPKVIKKENP